MSNVHVLRPTRRPSNGRIYVVGAGPGDPDLLTLRAVRCILSEAVVVHDDGLDRAILELVPAGALTMPVGIADDGPTREEVLPLKEAILAAPAANEPSA